MYVCVVYYVLCAGTYVLLSDYSRPPASSTHKHRILSTDEIEHCIRENELVEYEKINGHYAGTAAQQIKDVMQASKTCLLVIQPQVLHLCKVSQN